MKFRSLLRERTVRTYSLDASSTATKGIILSEWIDKSEFYHFGLLPQVSIHSIMENELTIQCTLCDQVLMQIKGNGPSIKGDGLKMSCRKCMEKNKMFVKLKEIPPIDSNSE